MIQTKKCLIIFFLYVSAYSQGPMYQASYQQAELIINNAASYTSEENDVTNSDNQVLNSHLDATTASVSESTNGVGSYVIEVTSTQGSLDFARHYHNAITNGEIYEYKVLIRRTVGSVDARFSFTGTTSSQLTNFSHSTWTEYTGEITSTGTQIILNVYANVSAGSVGDKTQYKYSLKLKND